MTKEMRMDAYYYGFKRTGEDCVDLILSAVACAGKAFHHTNQWSEDDAEPNGYNERLRGSTMTDGIQNAAADAAKEIASLRTRLSAAEAERDQALNTAEREQEHALRLERNLATMRAERDEAERRLEALSSIRVMI